jgi:hypothetical protein
MMKGYEDAVYENLCKHYPASKLFLKRSKTPPKSYIDIGDVEKLVQPSIPEDRQIESESTDQIDSNFNKPESIVVVLPVLLMLNSADHIEDHWLKSDTG